MSAIRNFALVAVAAAALAGSAQAQGTAITPGTQPVAGHRGHGHDKGDKMGEFKNLNLTDAQQTQIKAIRAKYKPQMKAAHDQAKPLMEAARAARQKGDTVAFRTNMEKARQVTSGARDQEMNEVRSVLTAEQRTKLEATMAQRKQNGGKHGDWKKGKKNKSRE